MNARIVLFLGRIGDAREARYQLVGSNDSLAEKETYLLPWPVLMQSIIGSNDEPVTQIVVIGSEQSYTDWKDDIEYDACRAGFDNRAKAPIAFLCYEVDTFSPGNPEFWRFFDTLRQALAGEPIADLPRFQVSPSSDRQTFEVPADRVTVDITRGYRAFPFIGAAALAFVRADDRRLSEERRKARRHRILYAADDAKAKDDDPTPVWDLTPFIDGIELSDALDAFTRHGRADDLSAFFSASQVPAASKVAESMRQFADDLLLMRIPDLLQKSGPDLQVALTKSIEDLKEAFPPVTLEIDRFKEEIDKLVPNGQGVEPVSPQGVEAAGILAQRLWHTGRYAELYNLLRESLLTAFSVVAVDGDNLQPGDEAFKKYRGGIENKCRKLNPENPPSPRADPTFHDPLPPQAQMIASQFGSVANQRNDVAHCSMGSNHQSQEDLKASLERGLKDFTELVASLSPSQ